MRGLELFQHSFRCLFVRDQAADVPLPCSTDDGRDFPAASCDADDPGNRLQMRWTHAGQHKRFRQLQQAAG